VTLNTASVDTNHAERDKHIRSDDFLNVSKHPTATFASTSVKSTGEGTADISGDLTLNGVTKPVVIAAKFVGEGKDPWGGFRAGFEGTTTLKLKDFDITKDLGPASESVELIISVEGVRK
jgi:polyisoprenoid-binding protein YceI